MSSLYTEEEQAMIAEIRRLRGVIRELSEQTIVNTEHGHLQICPLRGWKYGGITVKNQRGELILSLQETEKGTYLITELLNQVDLAYVDR